MIDKPNGSIGALNPKITPTGPRLAWDGIVLPKTKEGKEKHMMERFIKNLELKGVRYNRVYQNTENHFDFSLITPDGQIYVDLMELVYKKEKGDPYKNKLTKINVGIYADQIIKNIMKKSSKYVSNEDTPIHLLTYITHWNFKVEDALLQLLRYRLMQAPPVFEKIYYLYPNSKHISTNTQLYPWSMDAFTGFNENHCRSINYVNGDMESSRQNADGTVTTTLDVTELFYGK